MTSKTQQSQQGHCQLTYLNQRLKEYCKLSPEEQDKVRKEVIAIVKHHRDQFRIRLEHSHAQLQNLNLILGVTGSGKSTLFNYLNRLPLIIKQGLDAKGQKNHTIRLAIDYENIKEDIDVAPIGHGLVSETTIPNFAPAPNSDVTYVDFAEEFDSRDILQSIINSYLKYELASQAKKVKLTLVLNYNDIYNSRASAFRQLLKEVGNFVGLWEELSSNKCISLVVTQVKPQIKDPKKSILSAIEDIYSHAKDLGPFKEILEDIVQREAVAIFLQPKYKMRQEMNEDGEMQYHPYVPEGDPYRPSPKVCSPELISQTLQETNFMNCKEGLFMHNLQKQAQDIVNIICESLITDIKAQLTKAIIISLSGVKSQRGPVLRPTVQQINAEKSQIMSKIQKLKQAQNLDDIIQIFNVREGLLYKYTTFCSDLNEFIKKSNIFNIEEKLLMVRFSILNFLNEKVINLGCKAFQLININYKDLVRRNAVMQKELHAKSIKLETQLRKLQSQIREVREYQIKQSQKETEQNQLSEQIEILSTLKTLKGINKKWGVAGIVIAVCAFSALALSKIK